MSCPTFPGETVPRAKIIVMGAQGEEFSRSFCVVSVRSVARLGRRGTAVMRGRKVRRARRIVGQDIVKMFGTDRRNPSENAREKLWDQEDIMFPRSHRAISAKHMEVHRQLSDDAVNQRSKREKIAGKIHCDQELPDVDAVR